MSLLFTLLREQLRLVIISVCCSAGTGVVSTLIIRDIRNIIVLSPEFKPDQFAISFFSKIVLYLIFAASTSIAVSKLTQRIIHNLRLLLAGRILNTKYDIVESLRSDVFPILTDDVSTISTLFDRLPGVITGFATVIGILVYLFYLSPVMGLLTVSVFVVAYIISRFSMKFVGRYSLLNRLSLDKVYRRIEGIIYGLSTLIQNRRLREHYVSVGLKNDSDEQTSFYYKQTLWKAFSNRLNDTLLLSFLGLVILLINYKKIVEFEFFSTYLTLVLFMLNPLSTINGFWSLFVQIKVLFTQFEKLSDYESKAGGAPVVKNDMADSEMLIELKNVKYVYPEVGKKVREFSLLINELRLKKGSLVMIEGGNGSGKSTLIKVISGLYLPQEGEIWYKNMHVNDDNIDYYRNQFAVILTDSFVFQDMAYLSKEKLKDAAKYIEMIALEHEVELSEDGLFTTKKLSTGQQKRLQLVHMLLEDREVYIFDEWVAHQDSQSKTVFYEKVIPYLQSKGKTVINIAHDYSFERSFDQVLGMEDGKLVEIRKRKVQIGE